MKGVILERVILKGVILKGSVIWRGNDLKW